MRPRFAAPLVALLALSALADRAMRPSHINHTGVAAPDGRIAVVGEKFVARKDLKLRLHALDGGDPSDLFEFPAAPDAWWVSPDGKRVVWTAGGKLFLGAVGGAACELGGPPDGEVSFAANGSRFAFVRNGGLVGVELGTTKVVELAMRKDRVAVGSPVLSGDGKRAYVLTAAGKSLPNAVDCATFETTQVLPTWSVEDGSLHGLSSAGAIRSEDKLKLPPGAEDRLAFVVTRKDGEELSLWTGEDGSVTPVMKTESLADTAIAPDATWIAVTGRSKAGRLEAWAVDTQRSGTMREYASDPLAAVENADLSAIRITRDGETIFVAKPVNAGKTTEVIGGGKRW